MTTTGHELLLGAAIVYVTGLAFTFYLKTSAIRRQQRRYPAFRARDAFVRLRIQEQISQEHLNLLAILCNDALLLSEPQEPARLAELMTRTTRNLKDPQIRQILQQMGSENTAFAKAFTQLIDFIVYRVILDMLRGVVPMGRLRSWLRGWRSMGKVRVAYRSLRQARHDVHERLIAC